MGKLLCEKKLRDVWCRNESVRAEIGQMLHTHTHTPRARAAKLVVEIAALPVQMVSFVLPEFQGQRLGCGFGIFLNSTVRDCPVILKYRRHTCGCTAIRDESDRILVGQHKIG